MVTSPPEFDHPGTLLCITAVSQHMGADTSAGEDRMEKINVRVPEELLAQIEEEWERRGYSSKSEAIRDALRSWVNPPVKLSEEILDDLAVSREQRKRGETVPAEEVRERLGLDDDE
jgi:Arc/MetJ-type ribon-helix-helix transcriptional regulator